MTPDIVPNLVANLSQGGIWELIKIFYVLAFIIYVGFSIVVISQVKQMTSTVCCALGRHFVFLSWIHFGLSLLALLWAVMVL